MLYKKAFFFLSIFILLGQFSFIPVSNITNRFNNSQNVISSTNYVIKIQNNADLQSYSINGNGSEVNPFIISNYNIKCPNSSSVYSSSNGILIANTTAYFLLDNFSISNCWAGFRFSNVEHGSVSNSTVNNSVIGLDAIDSNWITANELTIQVTPHGGLWGFYFYSAHNIIIENSKVDGLSTGFDFSYLYYASLINNTYTSLTTQSYGFRFSDSKYVNLTDNKVSHNDEGFYLDHSDYFDITNNSALNDSYSGFYLNYSNLNNLTNNSAISCGYYSFFLDYSDLNNFTQNTVFSSSVDGFNLHESNSNYFIGNSVFNNSNYGFYLSSSNSNVFINNSSKNNGKGDFYSKNSGINILENNSFPHPFNYLLSIEIIAFLLIVGIIVGIVLKKEFDTYQKTESKIKDEQSFSDFFKQKIFSLFKR